MDDAIMISALNHYLYCPRRCALIHIEGIFEQNEHTVMGSLLHERTDKPGYEMEGDVVSLRALPLFSKRYGLVGKADVVEMRDDSPVPIEYKKGKKKKWDNDDIQLCAQALCLEDMLKVEVPRGYVYHAGSKRRREVVFDAILRRTTTETIEAARRLLRMGKVPPAILAPQCKGCSLHSICLPELTDPARGKGPEMLWGVELSDVSDYNTTLEVADDPATRAG